MQKTQNRIIQAALADLANGMTMVAVAAKYGITQGTISKWKAKYGIISSNDGIIPSNIPSNEANIPSYGNTNGTRKPKSKIRRIENGRLEINGVKPTEDYNKWHEEYEAAVANGDLLF